MDFTGRKEAGWTLLVETLKFSLKMAEKEKDRAGAHIMELYKLSEALGGDNQPLNVRHMAQKIDEEVTALCQIFYFNFELGGDHILRLKNRRGDTLGELDRSTTTVKSEE